jgi:hypothetical protein
VFAEQFSTEIEQIWTFSINHEPQQFLMPVFFFFFFSKTFLPEDEEMLKTKDYFKNGQLDKEGLVNFIKDIKKNTKLSDEDAAILAASK